MRTASLAAGLVALGLGGNAAWQASLAREVDAALASFPGELSLYVRDVASGEAYAHDAATPTYLSSAIKVVVMLEVLRQVDEGRLRLTDRVVFGPDDVRDGVGPVKRGPPGRVFTVRQLLALMMDYSENAAADLLMGKVGLARLNQLPRSRGVAFSEIDTLLGERRRIWAQLNPKGAALTPQRILELGEQPGPEERARLFSRMVGHAPAFTGADVLRAFRSFYAQRVNSASMREMGRLLEQVARCDGLSASSCRLARELMGGCQTGTGRIRAGLPTDVEWDHKTGTQEARACDVGILYPRPGRPVVVAACTRDFADVADAERLLRRVGVAVWRSLGTGIRRQAEAQTATRPPPAGERRVRVMGPPSP
ncbi:MAG: serine hydrolase [Myxococcales bacterium]